MKPVVTPALQEKRGAPDPEAPRVQAAETVSRIEVDAFVLGSNNRPIPDLSKDDFKVLVDGVEVPLESAEFIPAAEPERALPPPELRPPGTKVVPGRLFVIVCQTDFGRVRAKGQMRLNSEAGPFLEALLPTDRVAVVSFDSHLKLRQDFTSDKTLILDAMERSLMIEKVAPWPAGEYPSLGAGLDPAECKKAGSIDRSLELVARALKPFPGPKAILFLGWGLAVNHSPREGRELGRALAALLDARVHVFTLDVTDADYHSLEWRLRDISELTGGHYEKTYHFRGSLERVQKQLEGRYVLVFARPKLGYTGFHKVDIELVGKKGRVLARPGYED